MAVRTFSATIDNTWHTAGNWDVAPGAADDCVIAADCVASTDLSGTVYASLTVNNAITLTVANNAQLVFSGTASAITGTLLVQTGGAITFTDMTCTVTVTTGTITMDGGTLNLVRAAATTILLVNGTVTTTANGGTINNNANANNGVYVQIGTGGSISGFSAAVLLLIDGTAGANYTKGIYASAVSGVTIQWVDVLNKTAGIGFHITVCLGGRGLGCIARGADGANLQGSAYRIESSRFWLRDSYGYFGDRGIRATSSVVVATNCTFGQTPASAPAANTHDIRSLSYPSHIVLRGCLLASATELGTGTSALVISTATDGDESATGVKIWDCHPGADIWHLIAGEGTVLHTGGGKAVSFVTANDTSTDENKRLRFPVALWPAVHGDTLDVTLWVRTTNNTNKIKVIVDPDSIFGTTQEIEVTAAAADTYELATVPQYTVNTSAGVKSVIPIVVQIEEATKTWYVDDLSINGKAQTLDYGAYDGVLPIESIGTVRSPIGLTGGIHS